MRWISRFFVPPTLIFFENQLSGWTQNFVMPTTSSSMPRTHNNSVSDGTREIILDGLEVSEIICPVWSIKSGMPVFIAKYQTNNGKKVEMRVKFTGHPLLKWF